MWNHGHGPAQKHGRESALDRVPAPASAPALGPGAELAHASGGVGVRRRRRRFAWVVPRVRRLRRGAGDAGMATSEYAMGLLAAVGFAGLLYKVVTSGPVRAGLQALVERALHVRF
ncbi:DUF4244 domain-containing protein [Streptomyces longispororuber]|nr:DUF4244 domain-containing protein [Streptomyces longispororuber]